MQVISNKKEWLKIQNFIKRLVVRPLVFWPPLIIFLALVFLSISDEVRFLKITTFINNKILDVFSSMFSLAAFFFLVTCIWAALSPLGRVVIGGKGSKPILSFWSWVSITLTTTLAVGILFWGTAEPLFHLYDTGIASVVPASDEALRFSMSSLYMHWSFTPYAIYTLPGLTFALVYYNLRLPFSLSAPLSVLTGKQVPSVISQIVDGIALLALLFGLSASLGSGILSISGGISRLLPLETNSTLLGVITIVIVFTFFISSASGLHKGIKLLADLNIKIFLILIIFIFTAGPTYEILNISFNSIINFSSEFLPRSLLMKPFDNKIWLNDWTVFYFANWMAWAPLAALFLGKISLGYTVRQYILVNLFIPALFSIIWMSVFGGLTLILEKNNPNLLNDVLNFMGPEYVLYKVLEFLPFTIILVTIICLVSFLSYVTAADSNMDVISDLCLKPNQIKSDRQKIMLKFIWSLLIGFTAWMMISLSGIDGIKMLSNLGGFPSLFIITIFNLVLIILGTIKIKHL